MNASAPDHANQFDVLIIGGGINGAGIARDAAGRGFSVCLCEAGDFGGGTSSSSTKLFHGGLRYLEYLEFRLVREALDERETLLRAMPHISWPMRFVLPYHRDMRFEDETPTLKLLSVVMPWLKGKRPAWLIRLGLYIYDHLGGGGLLPPTRTLDLTTDAAGKPLKDVFTKAFEYSDCWVEDSRLVVLNLRDAAARGAEINRSTGVERAIHDGDNWSVTLHDYKTGATRLVSAKLVVNAAGPWADQVLREVFGREKARNIRLVRGSHIVIGRKYDHDRCYFFQNADTRVIFAIPYERDYTLIGTTDVDHGSEMTTPTISQAEKRYLIEMANAYFAEPIAGADIVWTYSGVRALFDDGAPKARQATRDYVIRREPELGNGSVLNIFGGKITTYRRLAEATLDEIEQSLGRRGAAWTRHAALPGGDFPVEGYPALVAATRQRHPYLDQRLAERLVRLYGTEVAAILGDAASLDDLGPDFGHGLHAAEIRHLMAHEWARDAEDVLFRRTRLGIRMTAAEIAAVGQWMAAAQTADEPAANREVLQGAGKS